MHALSGVLPGPPAGAVGASVGRCCVARALASFSPPLCASARSAASRAIGVLPAHRFGGSGMPTSRTPPVLSHARRLLRAARAAGALVAPGRALHAWEPDSRSLLAALAGLFSSRRDGLTPPDKYPSACGVARAVPAPETGLPVAELCCIPLTRLPRAPRRRSAVRCVASGGGLRLLLAALPVVAAPSIIITFVMPTGRGGAVSGAAASSSLRRWCTRSRRC